jgi:hypothetical protein
MKEDRSDPTLQSAAQAITTLLSAATLPAGYSLRLETRDGHGRHSDPERYGFICLYHGDDFIDSNGRGAGETDIGIISDLEQAAARGEKEPYRRWSTDE